VPCRDWMFRHMPTISAHFFLFLPKWGLLRDFGPTRESRPTLGISRFEQKLQDLSLFAPSRPAATYFPGARKCTVYQTYIFPDKQRELHALVRSVSEFATCRYSPLQETSARRHAQTGIKGEIDKLLATIQLACWLARFPIARP